MAINPDDITTARVGQLPPASFSLTDLIPHEVGTVLSQGTIQSFADFLATYIDTTGAVAFRPVTVLDGQTLPDTTELEWILVGKGTFINVNGGADITTTEELNALMSNGTYWFIGVEIPIEVEGIGYTPESIANKISEITTYSEVLYPNEKAVHDLADTKLNITDLPSNLTLYPTTTASAIGGYFKMVTSPDDPDYDATAVDVSTGSITTTDQLISSLVAPSGTIIGQPGIINITTIGNIRRVSGTGTATFYFELYHRNLAGTETFIGVSNPTMPITNAVYAEFSTTAVWNDGTFLETDTIVIKYYGDRVAGGVNPVYEFQFGGLTPVRSIVPVAFNVLAGDYELKENKQNSLTADGTGVKYPTVDAVRSEALLLNSTSQTVISEVIFEDLKADGDIDIFGNLILTDGAFKDTITTETLTANRTVTFKDESGTVAFISDISGSGATNLGYTPSPTAGIVTSDTGTDATIPLADGTNAGLLKPVKYTVLENTTGTNTGDQDLSGKQDTLVSGTNIKTINGDSVLGSGNLIVGGDMTASEINTTVEGVITTLTTNGYTLQLSDADTRINLAIAVGSSSVIVPTNAVVAFPIGTKIKLSRTANGTTLTAISGSGVTFIAPNGLNIYGNNNSATLIKIATNTWEVHITIPFYYTGGLIFSDIGFYAPAFYATQLYADNFGINGGVRLTSATNWLVYGKTYTNADGIYPSMYCSSTFSPTSGTAQFQGLALNMVINQTGGANGITTGLRVNPTLTSAFDFRAVDVVSGSIVLPYLTKTATYSISNNDYLIDCTSGTFTVTLPTAVGQKGKNYVIKNSGAGVITVATTSSQTIDGATTYSLAVQYNSITIVSDNTNWIIISKT